MRLYEFVNSGENILYHSVRNEERAYKVLNTGTLEGRTTQDIADKKVNGISTTRRKLMALRWGVITFVLDKTKISHNYKIVPIDWQQTNKDQQKIPYDYLEMIRPRYKRRRDVEIDGRTYMYDQSEEFVLAKSIPIKSYCKEIIITSNDAEFVKHAINFADKNSIPYKITKRASW